MFRGLEMRSNSMTSFVKFIFLKVELVSNKLNKVLTAVMTVNLYFFNVFTKFFKSLGLVIKIFLDPI